MNHDLPPFDDAAREREWQAQERALHAEHDGIAPAGADARERRYRLIARALREPLPDALPADFARHVAALAADPPTRAPAARMTADAILIGALMACFGVAAGVVVALYGQAWLPAFHAILPSNTPAVLRWPLALVACMGLSWLLAQAQRRMQHPPLA